MRTARKLRRVLNVANSQNVSVPTLIPVPLLGSTCPVGPMTYSSGHSSPARAIVSISTRKLPVSPRRETLEDLYVREVASR